MRNDHKSQLGGARRSGRGRWVLGLTAAVVTLAGCDSLLDVSVPTAQTEEDYFQPFNGIVLARAVAGQVECSYSRFVSGNAAGAADVFTQIDDDVNGHALYRPIVGGGNSCTTGGDEGYDWFEPFQTARSLGERTYDALANDWTDADIEESFKVEGPIAAAADFESAHELRAFVALYTAIPFQVFGEFMCEVAFDTGPLVAPDVVLQSAEDFVDLAFDAIGSLSAPNIALPYGITVGGGYSDFAYALRARIKWAQGDLAGAALDASMVTEGFVANVTRGTEVNYRENDVHVAHYERVYNSVKGPVTSAEWGPISRLDPVVGVTWPDPIPFTGYLDLMVDADGRAITAAQNPITGANAAAGAVADTRVQVALFGTTGRYRPLKYPTQASPIPLVNWEEAWLIRAEAAATPAAAIGFVNDIRVAHGLPLVTYGPTTADEIEDMIIEERRRSLFLEGRFWATKLHNTDKLWFPRSDGEEIAPNDLAWGGGVRMVMTTGEFNLNTNIVIGSRNTLCPVDERPIVLVN